MGSMKRPSFQFYPGDWTSNSNLRRCSHAEKGVWVDVLCLLHDQEEYGLVRWPLKEIAQAVNCTVAVLRGIVAKGILKGADANEQVEPFVYVPRSGRKDGDPVILVNSQVGPLWYSSRMVKDEYIRTIRGEMSRFGAGEGETPKGAPKASPKGGLGEGSGDGSSASSSSSASPNTSVPNGTDADASPLSRDGMSAKEAIFHIAVPWLVERGVPDKSARSLMGGADKQLGSDGAWALAQQFMREQPLEPAAWIAGAINAAMKPAKGRPNKQEALEARNRAIAERLAQEEA
jgi:hypothetical protein